MTSIVFDPPTTCPPWIWMRVVEVSGSTVAVSVGVLSVVSVSVGVLSVVSVTV